jgi:hypothetical protein
MNTWNGNAFSMLLAADSPLGSLARGVIEFGVPDASRYTNPSVIGTSFDRLTAALALAPSNLDATPARISGVTNLGGQVFRYHITWN